MKRPNYRIGSGYDIHRLEVGHPLWLCGIKIEHSKGAVAHSDGDTALHALCDALLGALALGDIGVHFPDTSIEYRGIDSKELLKGTYSLILKEGYRLANVDITIVLQRPKLAPHITRMRQTVASILECEQSLISVKASTAEELDAVGKGDAVAAYATVLLENNLPK